MTFDHPAQYLTGIPGALNFVENKRSGEFQCAIFGVTAVRFLSQLKGFGAFSVFPQIIDRDLIEDRIVPLDQPPNPIDRALHFSLISGAAADSDQPGKHFAEQRLARRGQRAALDKNIERLIILCDRFIISTELFVGLSQLDLEVDVRTEIGPRKSRFERFDRRQPLVSASLGDSKQADYTGIRRIYFNVFTQLLGRFLVSAGTHEG